MADGRQMADLCYTITPNTFHMWKNAHIPMADGPPMPPQIDHRPMLFNYIHKVSYIKECTYTHGRWVADGRSMLHNYTQNVSHIEELAYTHDRWTPLIDHRSRLHHSTQ